MKNTSKAQKRATINRVVKKNKNRKAFISYYEYNNQYMITNGYEAYLLNNTYEANIEKTEEGVLAFFERIYEVFFSTNEENEKYKQFTSEDIEAIFNFKSEDKDTTSAIKIEEYYFNIRLLKNAITLLGYDVKYYLTHKTPKNSVLTFENNLDEQGILLSLSQDAVNEKDQVGIKTVYMVEV